MKYKFLSLATKIILLFFKYSVLNHCDFRSREAGSKSNCLAALKPACYKTTQVQTEDDNTD